MRKTDGREFWEDIVQLTGAAGHQSVPSLRVALLVLLRCKDSPPFLRELHSALSAAYSLLPRRKTPLSHAVHGKMLFCFPHRSPSNINNLLPVAREADRRGLLGGIVLSDDCSGELAEFRNRIPMITMGALIAQLGISEKFKIAMETISVFRDVSSALSRYDAALARRFYRNAGRALREIVRCLQMAPSFWNLLGLWSPSCVVSTSDLWPAEYQLAYQASRKDIPSVVIQHGNTIHYYWPFVADLWVMWGQQSYQEMLDLGAPASRLAIGGMPALDSIFTRGPIADVSCAKRGHACCVILSQTHGRVVDPELFSSYRKFLSELVPIVPNVRWKVKLHPSEDQSFYDQLNPEVRRRLEFYPPAVTLDSALVGADVAMTLTSTSGLDAMARGVPVIVPVVAESMLQPGVQARLHGAILVRTPEEFRRECERLNSDITHRVEQITEQRKAVNLYFANQGYAGAAIMDLLDIKLNLNKQNTHSLREMAAAR